MNEDRQVEVLLEQAEVQRRLANHRGAIALVQRALGLDPDHARGHAVLAEILLDARRLPGAVIEIGLALGLDGNDRYIHHVAAAVRAAQRKLDDAWAHCLIAIEGSEAAVGSYVLASRIRALRGESTAARELVLEALAIDAAHTEALTQLAQLELDAGRRGEAAHAIERALASDPVDHDAHIVAGHIALRSGDAAGAERHARFVLHQNANDQAGLELWASIQARRSWLLGAWWRLNAWLSTGDDRRRIAFLIGGFVVIQLAVIVADELDHGAVSSAIAFAWLGLCAYTWFAPALFRRMLARSLGTVTLDPDY